MTDAYAAASLHPATVTGFSTGAVRPATRRPSRRTGWVTDPLVRRQIDDRVLAASIRTAGGDPNRLWFDEDDGAVWILNHTRAETCPSAACPACVSVRARRAQVH